MSDRPPNTALTQLRRFLAVQQATQLSDEQLLQAFVKHRDEVAFAALMKRHAPMVLSVCQSVLRQAQDAEDCCQATFLVLARKASSIRKKTSVASWLHGVAQRMSKKLQATGHKTAPQHDPESAASNPADDLSWREVRQIVHEELQRLPLAYRLPLIHCYLEGQTQEKAATRLGWTAATLKGRLDRGRAMLHRRLTRRGIGLAVPIVAVCLAPKMALAGMVNATAQSAVRVIAGGGFGDGVSAQAAALAKAAIKAALLTKLTLLLAVICCVVAGGVGLASWGAGAANVPVPKRKHVPAAMPIAAAPLAAVVPDLADLLPQGVRARLGTTNFRHVDTVQSEVSFSPDSSLVASTDCHAVYLWETQTGRCWMARRGGWCIFT